MRHLDRRKPARNAAEPRTDGGHVKLERHHHQCCDDNGYDRSGYSSPRLWPNDKDHEREHAESEGLKIGLRQVLDEGGHLFGSVSGHLHAQAKKLFQLADEDDDRDPTRKTRRDRVGDELDQAAEFQRAHYEQYDARHDRRDDQTVVSVLGHDPKQDWHKRARWPADLDEAAAERGDEESGNDSGPQSPRRFDAGSDGEPDGQRQRDNADRDPGRQIREKRIAVVSAQRFP